MATVLLKSIGYFDDKALSNVCNNLTLISGRFNEFSISLKADPKWVFEEIESRDH